MINVEVLTHYQEPLLLEAVKDTITLVGDQHYRQRATQVDY